MNPEPAFSRRHKNRGAAPRLGINCCLYPPFRFASSTPANATPAFAGDPGHGGLTSVPPSPHASCKTGARRRRGSGLEVLLSILDRVPGMFSERGHKN